MSNVTWTITPVDTWFFRQGIPFEAGDHVSSQDILFPPHMTTLQGAIRTAIARQQGWVPGHDALWPAALGTPDDLGALSLEGPFLRKGNTILYPVPRCLLRTQTGQLVRLRPGPPVESDLGIRSLPVLARPRGKEEKVSELEGAYITLEGLTLCLQGEMPPWDSLVQAEELWQAEPRIGLTLNAPSKTAQNGLLYRAAHIRLLDDVALIVTVTGLPVDWQDAVTLMPLGGENRFARVRIDSGSVPMPHPEIVSGPDGVYRVFALLLTPGLFADPQHVLTHGPFPVPCVSAVTDRIAMRGGWDLRRHIPRDLRPFVPAGSVWFYEWTPDQWHDLQPPNGTVHEGMDTEYGFGHMIFGQWEE